MSIDDDSAHTGPAIPDALGEGLRVAFDLERRPRNFSEYVGVMATFVEREGLEVDLDTLCTTDESPHRATFRARTQHYHCPLDAIIVPFLADEVERAEIETTSPVSGAPVRYTVTGTTFEVDPSEAVLSFGVATDVETRASARQSPVVAYRRICPYGKAFISEAEYEHWADGVDAYTMPISFEDSFELARALGQLG